jgi:hypothetical protein
MRKIQPNARTTCTGQLALLVRASGRVLSRLRHYTLKMQRFGGMLLLSMLAVTFVQAQKQAPAQAPAQGQAARGGESYQVYSASLPFGYHTAGMMVAIRSRTVPVPDLAGASDSVQREFTAMQADPELKAAIRQMITARPSGTLLPDFHLAGNARVELLDSDQLDSQLRLNDTALGRKAGWRSFNQTHEMADGLTEVSAVGFNPAHTVAVFYAMHRSGTGCNDEGFEVLRKTDGRWQRFADKGFSFAACN